MTECYRFEGTTLVNPRSIETRAEVQEYLAKDGIPLLPEYLLGAGVATPADINSLEAHVRDQIADAVKFAMESPEPDPGSALDYNYAEQE